MDWSTYRNCYHTPVSDRPFRGGKSLAIFNNFHKNPHFLVVFVFSFTLVIFVSATDFVFESFVLVSLVFFSFPWFLGRDLWFDLEPDLGNDPNMMSVKPFFKAVCLASMSSFLFHSKIWKPATSGKHVCEINTPLNPTFIQKNWGLQGYTYFSYV